MHQRFIITLKKLNPGYSIFILSIHYPFHSRSYQWNGVTVLPFNGRNRGGLHRFLYYPKIKRAFKNLHASFDIAGIISFWYGECALLGQTFSKKYSLPHYCWVLGQDARVSNDYPRKLSIPAENLVALSDSIRHEFEKNHGIRPGHMVPPGMNDNEFNCLSSERDIDILGAGSLIPLKQFSILVQVVAALKKKFPSIKAIIAGTGPEKEFLEKMIIQHGLVSNITLTGELPYEEVLKLMQRTKILIHPSSYEGFSGVCQEAIAAGAHVVSFCRAMDHPIPQWHIVENQEEMIEKANKILEQKIKTDNIIPYRMENSVHQFMELLRL